MAGGIAAGGYRAAEGGGVEAFQAGLQRSTKMLPNDSWYLSGPITVLKWRASQTKC